MADANIRYLTPADLIALHRYILTRLGATPVPVRDEGALEAALLRPQMAAHYEGADFIRQAALLAIGISQAQGFLDGNKRAAYAALRAFLRTNGLAFTGLPLELASQLESVATRSDSLADATARFEAYLRDHMSR